MRRIDVKIYPAAIRINERYPACDRLSWETGALMFSGLYPYEYFNGAYEYDVKGGMIVVQAAAGKTGYVKPDGPVIRSDDA